MLSKKPYLNWYKNTTFLELSPAVRYIFFFFLLPTSSTIKKKKDAAPIWAKNSHKNRVSH
jgi:hypothetical protein